MRRFAFTTLFAALFLVGCAPRQKSLLGFEKPEFAKAPPELMRRIAEAGDPFSYPNANSIIIELVDSAVYDETGRLTDYTYVLTKPITPQGLKDESVHKFQYDSQMFEVDILYAAVIHPDSTVEFVPESLIIDQVMSEEMSQMDIYWTNLREKIVRFPQLNLGDAVAIAYKYTMLKPYFEGVIQGNGTFQATEPLHSVKFVCLIPKSVAGDVRYKVFNDREGRVSFREWDWCDYHVFCWSADSVPALVSEVGMPPVVRIVPLVLFSNVDWRGLSRKAWEVTEPPMVVRDTALVSTVRALVETCRTEYDSARAIILWVAQDVRYIGLSLGDKEGITPHDVNETFKARSGVCKDKSALAVAMLRQAGIDAYNVLTNPLSDILYDVAVNQFNHQIVLARLRDGREVFADVTDDVCKDLLPGYYSKKGYLVLAEEGEDLRYFDLIPPERNLGKVEAKSRIDADGNLTSEVRISGKGLYDEALRQIKQYLEPEDQRRLARHIISQIDPNATLVDFSLEPDPASDLSRPAVMTIKYKIPEYAVAAGDFLLLSIPTMTHVFDIVAQTLEEYTKLQERHFPLHFLYTYGVDVVERIELAGNYRAKSLPKPVRIEGKYFTYVTDCKIKGNEVESSYTLRLKDVDVPLEDYKRFRENVTRYKNSAKGMLILTKESM